MSLLESAAEWLETGFALGIRLLIAGGIAWLIYKAPTVSRSGAGGLNAIEFNEYTKGALIAAGIACALGLFWSGAFCDGAAGFLLKFIDSPDNRPMGEDPHVRLNRLIAKGRIRSARRLCKRMIRRHEGSRIALETTLSYLADRQEGKIDLRPRQRISGGNKSELFWRREIRFDFQRFLIIVSGGSFRPPVNGHAKRRKGNGPTRI